MLRLCQKIIIFLSVVAYCSTSSFAFDIDKFIDKDNGQPLDISSGALIIKDNENVAIFRQEVLLQQGSMKLETDELRLYTSNKVDKNNKSQDTDNNIKSNSSFLNNQREFEKIQALGNVHLQAQQKEAFADNAEYNVKTQKIKFFGNVKIISAGNTLMGEEFIYDITSGQITILSNKEKNSDNSTTEDTSEANKSGRVRAQFVTEDDFTDDSKKINVPKFKFLDESEDEKKVQ